ncbi:MAG: hypothetical protein ABGZ35_26155 [Planctomycetaceae bacterium]
MHGLRVFDDRLAKLYDLTTPVTPCETLRKEVQDLLNSVTHEDTETYIHQFGEKLLFPSWRIDFQTHGMVFSLLFGNVREDGICRRLYQLFFEFVQLECGTHDRDAIVESRMRIRAALHRYLTCRGYGLASFPELSEFVPFPAEQALPFGLGYVLPADAPDWVDRQLGRKFTMSQTAVESIRAARQVEQQFSDLTIGPTLLPAYEDPPKIEESIPPTDPDLPENVLAGNHPDAQAFRYDDDWCTAAFVQERFGIRPNQLTKAATQKKGLHGVRIERVKAQVVEGKRRQQYVYHSGQVQILANKLDAEE